MSQVGIDTLAGRSRESFERFEEKTHMADNNGAAATPNDVAAALAAGDPTADPAGDPSTGDPATDQTGDAGKRALTVERAARATAEKRAAELAAKVEAYEQASLSEAEKLARRVESAEAERAQLQGQILRLKAAALAGIDVSDVDRLRGSTLDELVADAAELKARYAVPATPTDPGQGTRQISPQASLDAEYAAYYPGK